MTFEEKKLELWMKLQEDGWYSSGYNCLYRIAIIDGEPKRFRVNFRDDKIAKLELNRPTTDEEKREAGRSSIWELLQEQDYRKVTLDSEGNLSFGSSEENKSVEERPIEKKKRAKVKNTKERSS